MSYVALNKDFWHKSYLIYSISICMATKFLGFLRISLYIYIFSIKKIKRFLLLIAKMALRWCLCFRILKINKLLNVIGNKLLISANCKVEALYIKQADDLVTPEDNK